MIKTYKKGAKKKLSEHFNLSEMHCHGKGCCNKTKFDTDLLYYLEMIRNHFGKPLTINSAYRCPEHNAKVGGNKNSAHKNGMACDITFGDSVTRAQLSKYAESIGVPRIGTYKNSNNMIHIGTGVKCYWLDSDYSIKTFGGNTYPEPKRTIKKGCIGDDVKWIQYWLRDKGYRGKSGKFLTIDGKCGDNTIYAINRFRVANGWKPTGKIKKTGRKALIK